MVLFICRFYAFVRQYSKEVYVLNQSVPSAILSVYVSVSL